MGPGREEEAEEEREWEEDADDFDSASRPKVAISSTKDGRVVIVGEGDEVKRRTRAGILKARQRPRTI